MDCQDQCPEPSQAPGTKTKTASELDFTSQNKSVPERVAANYLPNIVMRPIWVLWKYEIRKQRLTKVPYQPTGEHASTADPRTWSDFDMVAKAFEEDGSGYDGIGFLITSNMVGIDLDKCIHGDRVEAWAAEIIRKFSPGFGERSPSGRGFHLLCVGSAQWAGKRGGPGNRLEVYGKTSKRYFTATGRLIGRNNTLQNRQTALDWLHAKYFRRPDPPKSQPRKHQHDWIDEELIARAITAKNGEKFKKLFQGNWRDDYPSQSEADLSLCSLLSFWCGNPEQTDRLFRQSKLMRDKWDSRRGNDTYGAQTIRRALTTR